MLKRHIIQSEEGKLQKKRLKNKLLEGLLVVQIFSITNKYSPLVLSPLKVMSLKEAVGL